MKDSTKQWQRNTDGLRSNAQRKAEATRQRAEAAIAQLIKEQRPINFQTVARAAGISTAWLYCQRQQTFDPFRQLEMDPPESRFPCCYC